MMTSCPSPGSELNYKGKEVARSTTMPYYDSPLRLLLVRVAGHEQSTPLWSHLQIPVRDLELRDPISRRGSIESA